MFFQILCSFRVKTNGGVDIKIKSVLKKANYTLCHFLGFLHFLNTYLGWKNENVIKILIEVS